MNYSADEVIQYIREADVKFIRLAFCDVFGRQKNIAVMPGEVRRAFEYGISVDASAIAGFGGEVKSDLLLHPDASTLMGLPWRPESGKVVRMFCDVTHPDGTPFEGDTRALLRRTAEDAKKRGVTFNFGSEMEFYLFKTDENGARTLVPHDNAGYMDIAPEDKGENVRREICLTLEKMGIQPESSHHEEGPGQNEIDFRYSDALTAADNAVTFSAVVRTIAARSGLYADFSPKPLIEGPGSGMHVNFSVGGPSGEGRLLSAAAGIMDKISEMTLFLNPTRASYLRLGGSKAPGYVSWSRENRSQLIRIPAASYSHERAELRSPDPTANPYIVFTLLIRAGLLGIEKGLVPPESVDINLYTAAQEVLERLERLPDSMEKAKAALLGGAFVRECLPDAVIRAYLAL